MFTDGAGRRLEVILLDRLDGCGPRSLIRASWHGVLLGRGYFECLDDALRLVDVGTLVEVITITR